MIYKITLTEEQMRVVQVAVEEYFRLRLGQSYSLVEDLIDMESDYMDPNHPEHKKLFERAMVKRDSLEEIMKAMFHIVFGPYGVPKEKTSDMMIAECVWDAIRFYRKQSKWPEPFHIGPEPTPNIEVIEDDTRKSNRKN